MVFKLVELKARLTWNGFRHDRQRRIGLPVATILLGWLGLWLAQAHYQNIVLLQQSDPAALPHYLAWTALIAFIVWVTLPVIIFPLDENLDPQQLATLPLTPNQMVTGLAASSLVAPSTIVPLALLAANAIAIGGVWWMAIPASFVYLALLAVGGQLFSAAVSAVLRTRRGRDIATFMILGLAAGSFFAYRVVSDTVAELGLAGAVTATPITGWWALLPPVAAQKAIVDVAIGNVGSGPPRPRRGVGRSHRPRRDLASAARMAVVDTGPAEQAGRTCSPWGHDDRALGSHPHDGQKRAAFLHTRSPTAAGVDRHRHLRRPRHRRSSHERHRVLRSERSGLGPVDRPGPRPLRRLAHRPQLVRMGAQRRQLFVRPTAQAPPDPSREEPGGGGRPGRGDHHSHAWPRLLHRPVDVGLAGGPSDRGCHRLPARRGQSRLRL